MELNYTAELARTLMEQYGLSSWNFRYDNAVRRFGCCNYRYKTISLSKKLVEINNEKEVKETILHEIAHAIVGIYHGHDEVWRKTAMLIGCDGNRCYSTDVVNTLESKYYAICPICGYEHKRNRLPKYGARTSCGRCSGGKFNPYALLIYKLRNC